MSQVTTEPSESRRSVLGRAFDILECFTDGEPEQTIGSLCAKTDLPPATVHRMLANLAEWGAVERAARGRYRLGVRLWRLGWGVPTVRRLKDIARPYLVDLHAATDAVTALGSRDGDQIVLADIIAGNAAVRRQRLPRQLPITRSASGWVFLANMPREEAAELVGRDGGVDRAGDFEFWQRLGEIRRTGVAVVRGTTPASLTWVAAPVFDHSREVRSTICVAVPGPQQNVVALSRAVGETARAVSRGLSVAIPTAS
ncbi:IclR family transcriptional regulator [Nocardioides sp. zg-DK7169]|uniref:IclR family transcriptional regulator n=1 Tax=Nocardioides sp. zg-DK7169 TaxID=2736600 RepID=UPI0015566BD2|nr:IclR family transcriptional regulator [Nocardioides sp. zg-DK7169]NPC97038.1 IclR family transcriptional regulator [Nocardioides sp. zg-DK7169]